MKPGKDGALPPLAEDVERLLEAERTIPAAPADVRARAIARARASLAQSVARPARGPRIAGRLRFAAAAGLILAGAGAIAGWQARQNAAPDTQARVTISPPAAPRPAAVVAPVDPVPVPTVEPPRAPAGRAHASSRDANQAQEAELRLIRQAQEAANVGRFEAALGPLAEHARRFPAGRLVEEREALRIRSLAKLGRVAEARRAAQTFRARFPRSVLLPRVGAVPSTE